MNAVLWLAALLVLLQAGSVLADPLAALVKAYPDQLSGYDVDKIYWRDGTMMPVSNGHPNKSFKQLLTNASIVDQLSLPYPRGVLKNSPALDADPGRFRNEPFFLKMYGDCRKGEVAPHLVPIAWLPKTWGQTIRVTKINGVAEHLSAVSAEIDVMPEAVKRAAYPIAGVLACRPVADTGRLSMHAFAAAIDLNVAISDYWLWRRSKPSDLIPYHNRMPQQIVDAFERHGFIWGGKWYHYDTMHFEYRPELLDTQGDE